MYFRDLNGMYLVETYETINPNWQGDFARVQFNLKSPSGSAYTDKDIYLAGQLTNYEMNDKTKMVFNGVCTNATCFLKQVLQLYLHSSG